MGGCKNWRCHYGWLVVLLTVLSDAMVLGCPNCRDAMAADPAQAGLVRGFFWSILFMLSMPFLILGGISAYFYWEVRRARRLGWGNVAAGSPFAATYAIDDLADIAPTEETAEELEPVGVG